jgi:hypothetical protein
MNASPTQSSLEIEKFIGEYFNEKDTLLEFLYSVRNDEGCFLIYCTDQRRMVLSGNVLKPKEVVSNKILNKQFKKFGDSINVKEDYTDDEWKIYFYDNEELLNNNNFWKILAKNLNARGYSLTVFMVEGEMNRKKYCEFFISAVISEDLVNANKGKISARNLGLIESASSGLEKKMYDIVDRNFPDLFGNGNTMLMRSEENSRLFFEMKISFDRRGEEPEVDDYHATRNFYNYEKITDKELEKLCWDYDPEVEGSNFYRIFGECRLADSEMLKRDRYWKRVNEAVESYGYRLKIVIADLDNEISNRRNKISVFLFLDKDEEFLKKHRGKIMGRNLGLIEKRLLNFEDFLFENKNTHVADLFRSLSRNYESEKFFYTDHLQFTIEEERRNWRDTRKYVELEKTVKHEANYYLSFKLDDKNYKINIDFEFDFKGEKEKDAPDTLSAEDAKRLSVVLTGIRVKKVAVSSSELNFVTSSPDESLKKAIMDFLQKMMSVDYDSLGSNLYNMQQK